jgi:hypothetical protein
VTLTAIQRQNADGDPPPPPPGPTSAKVIAATVGGGAGIGLGATFAELIGQIPAIQDAPSVPMKVLGSLLVLVAGMAGTWISGHGKEESEKFLAWATSRGERVEGRLLDAAVDHNVLTAGQADHARLIAQDVLKEIRATMDQQARLILQQLPSVQEIKNVAAAVPQTGQDKQSTIKPDGRRPKPYPDAEAPVLDGDTGEAPLDDDTASVPSEAGSAD